MRESVELNKKLTKEIMTKRIVKKRIKFGYGNLMPIYSLQDEVATMTVALHEGNNKVGAITPVEKGVRLAESAKPLVMMTFPKNETGIKSIRALRDWLENMERLIKEETFGTGDDYDNKMKAIQAIEHGYEVGKKYYAKIKGADLVKEVRHYWGEDNHADPLVVSWTRKELKTMERWNRIGINDSNADFEEVQE